jgi:hypothetical protein
MEASVLCFLELGYDIKSADSKGNRQLSPWPLMTRCNEWQKRFLQRHTTRGKCGGS